MAQREGKEQGPLQSGIVKQVLSGDSVVVRGQPKGGPPPERTLSLAGITAPRLARRPGGTAEDAESQGQPDEPLAWEAREFLRTLLVGKTVYFSVEYKAPSGREFVAMFTGNSPQAPNVAHLLVSEGLARVRDGKGGEEFEALKALQSAAQDAGKGVHGKENEIAKTVRNIKWFVDNPRLLVDKLKGKPVKAIIEQVRDASTVRAFLLPDFQYVTVMLSGIKAPAFKREDSGKEVAEPFAEEAKFYVESRLLQREVSIVLEGVNNSQCLGTVIHPVGNIAEFLLQDGFAKVVDWSIGLVTQGRDKYRQCEKEAKTKRLRIWRDYTGADRAVLNIKDKNFSAVVEEIVSADCIVLDYNGKPQRLFLSSIRGPKKGQAEESAAPEKEKDGGAQKARSKPLYDVPYMFEAREFLRTKLLGNKVDVEVDYIKPAEGNFPEKLCGTVRFGDINIAEALVSKGYATVIRHKSGDDQRSCCYDDLLAAEARAEKNQKGVHNPKEAPLHRISEISSKAQADKFLPSLKRAGRVTCLVEYIGGGARLRVYIPKETCLCQVLLAGISCPRSAFGATPGEPYGDQAAEFTRKKALQREVAVEFFDTDKNGNFVGHVIVGNDNLAELLLEQGLASLHFTADRYSGYSRFAAAEATAKSKKLNIWTNFDPTAERAQSAADEAVVDKKERTVNYKPAVVSFIPDLATVFLQPEESVDELATVMKEINDHFAVAARTGVYVPKKGEKCAAQFSDGQWYRAVALRLQGKTAEVKYIDYGNTETVDCTRMAPLELGTALPPQAREFKLALLNPPSKDYVEEAKEELSRLVLYQPVLYNVEYKDASGEYVTLRSADNQVDINAELIRLGFAMVGKRREHHIQTLLREYTDLQSAAKAGRQGMWEFGDPTSDEP